MIKLLLSKMNKKFFFFHLAAILFFAIIYYLQDWFVLSDIKRAKRLGLLEENIPRKYYSWKSSPFSYYIWYSLITQTTVGYGGVVDTGTGETVAFLDLPNRLFKVLNVIQLLSIIMISSLSFN